MHIAPRTDADPEPEDPHSRMAGLRRLPKRLAAVAVAAATLVAGLLLPASAAWAGAGGGSVGPTGSGGIPGSGYQYVWWAYDQPDHNGNVENNVRQWGGWSAGMDSNPTNGFSVMDAACDNAYKDALARYPGTSRGDYRPVLFGGFVGDNPDEPGKVFYRGKPPAGAMMDALNSTWPALEAALRAGNPGIGGAGMGQYLGDVLSRGVEQANNGATQICVVIDKRYPPSNVKPHTQANPSGTVSAGRQSVSDHAWFSPAGSDSPSTGAITGARMDSDLVYEGGSFLGNPIPANAGNQHGSADYGAGATGVDVRFDNKVILPGKYHWNARFSDGTNPGSIDGASDPAEQFGSNAPPVHTHATTSMIDEPSAGTNHATTDKINADIDKGGAVGDILGELRSLGVSVNYELSGTDELCYIPTDTERQQMPKAMKDKVGKGADPECTHGLETSGHRWTSRNGEPTSVTVKPTDFDDSMTGWTPGQYFYILKINDDKGRGITGAKLVGADPQVADEQVQTPTYGYTEVISSDKQMSNKQGTIIAGGTQPVYDYLTTTFYNNAKQTNGNYWTPEFNRPPAFKAQLTLTYHPDDTAKARGLTERSATQHLTLAAAGDKQKSGAFVPGDLGLPVWASGLYTWSHTIDNDENKDVARQCGANGAKVSCLQEYQSTIDAHTAPGQARVSADPTRDDGSGWVPGGRTVWNETGVTEPLQSLKQTYDKDNNVVITANGRTGNVSQDLKNGTGVPGGNVPNYGKGSILMDEMESYYAVYPQWQMRNWKTQQSFGPAGQDAHLNANRGERAHDSLTWDPTPVDEHGQAMQEPDGSAVNLAALGQIEPVDVTVRITLQYTAERGVKTTLKDGSQTLTKTIANAAGKGWDDAPDPPDFSPSGFSKATGQAKEWKVWEPGNYRFVTHVDAGPTDPPYLQTPVDDDGSSKTEQFLVLIPQVAVPAITTTTKGEGTWQDHLHVARPDDGWTLLPGGDFWDDFVPGDAMGVTYGVRLDHNDNILATDKANNPAPGQQAKGANGQDNPMTDSSVTRPVEGQRPWNWTGDVDSPVFDHHDFRPGTGSTIKDAKDSWTQRHSGTYWFETSANYHKAGLDPSAGTVAKDIRGAISGQSSTVTGDYVPMGSMEPPYAVDNTDGSKLTLSVIDQNANDRVKDEYFYNYTPSIHTHVTGLSQTVVAGAGPKPDGEVRDKISTQNGAVPQSTRYDAQLTLRYSTDLPRDNKWAAGAVTRTDKSSVKSMSLQNDSADQLPDADRFTPADFGWSQWQPGSYWFSISTRQTDAAQANAITDQNIGNEDIEEQFLVVAGKGNVKAVKSGRVTSADGKDQGQAFRRPGDKVKWTITVTNDGDITEKISISDGKPGFTGSGELPAFACPADELAPGASMQCTADYTITQADMDNPEWDILNTATVSYKGEDGSEGTVQTNGGLVSQTGGKGAKVTVAKTVDQVLDTMVTDPMGNGGTYKPVARDQAKPIAPDKDGKYAVTAGDTIDYGIHVTNSGDHTLTGVSLKDPLVEHQIQDAFEQANGINPDTAIDCPAGSTGTDSTLSPGQSFTCTAHYIVTQQDIDRGSVRNVATATADQTSGSAVSNDGTAATPIAKQPRLTDTKTSDHDGAHYANGDHITWTSEARNTGNTTLHHVKINDPEGDRGFNGKNPLKPLGCTIVSSNVVRDGNLFQDVDEGAYPNGEGTLKPGDKIVCKWSYDVVQDDVDGAADDSHVLGHHGDGEKDYSLLFNTSKSHADEADGNGARDEIIAPTSPDLKVVKTADRSYVQRKGDKIHYTIVMTNTGNVTLHNVYLQDMMPGVSPVTCADYKLASAPNKYDSDPLAPGQTVTCAADYTVTQDDIDHGSDYDIKPSGDPADSDPASDPSGHDKETHYDYGNVVDWAHKDHKSNPGVINVACTSYIGPHGESVNPACTAATSEVGQAPASGAALGIAKTGRLTDNDYSVDGGAAQALLHSTWQLSLSRNGSELAFDGFAPSEANKADNANTHDGSSDAVSAIIDGGAVQKATLKDGKTVMQLDPIADAGKRLTVIDDTVGATLFDGKPVQADGRIVSGKLAGAVRATAGWYIQLGSGGTQLTVTGANPGDSIAASVGEAGTPATALADRSGRAVVALDPAANDHQYLTVTDATVGVQLYHGVPVTDDGALIDGRLASGEDLPRHKDDQVQRITRYNRVGQSVSFDVTATNRGTVTLSGVHIIDPLDGLSVKSRRTTPAGKDDHATRLNADGTAVLAPGASLTVTYEHIITQADIDRGKLTDTAKAEGTEPHNGDTISSPDASATLMADQDGTLSMKKSSEYDGIGYQANQTSKYWFDVTNTGNTTLHGLNISEDSFDGANRLSDVECPTRTLAPGQSVRCSAHYTASQADVDRGTITNKARATGRLPQSGEADAEDSDTLHAQPRSSGVSVVKSVDQPATGAITKAGQKVHYRFDVTNTGNTTVTGVSIADPNLDGGKAYTDRENSAAAWPSLAPGQHIVMHGDHTVTDDDIKAGHIANQAAAGWTDQDGGRHQTPSNTVDTSTHHVEGLRITKAVDKDSVSKAGEVLHYTFAVTNGSGVKATGLSIDDPNLKGAPVTLAATDLEPGATTSGSADYTVTQADIDAGTALTNTATAYAFSPKAGDGVHDMTAVSNQTMVPVKATTGLKLTKTALTDRTDLVPGDRLDYRIDVTNTGTSTVRNLHVDDDHIDSDALRVASGTPDDGLDPGETASYTGSYTITEADEKAGAVINTAKADGTDASGRNVPSNPDSATNPIRHYAMDVAKTLAKPVTLHKPGDTVRFVVTVRNTGNQPLHAVHVGDVMTEAKHERMDCDRQASGPGQALAAGDTMTCKATHATTAEELDYAKANGSRLTNTATATTAEGLTGTASVDVPVDYSPSKPAGKPAIKVVETISPTSVKGKGSKTTMAFSVSNPGELTLRQVTLSDPLFSDGDYRFSPSPSNPEPANGSITLAPGETITATAEHLTTQAEVDAGVIKSPVTATGRYTSGKAEGVQTRSAKADDATARISSTDLREAVVEPDGDAPGSGTVSDSDDAHSSAETGDNTGKDDTGKDNTGKDTSKDDTGKDGDISDHDGQDAQVDGEHGLQGQEGVDSVSIVSSGSTRTIRGSSLSLDANGRRRLTEPVSKGDRIVWSHLASNTGDLTLHAVTGASSQHDRITWGKPAEGGLTSAGVQLGEDGATLAPGDHVTGTAVHTITDEDLSRGTVDDATVYTGTDPRGARVTARSSAGVAFDARKTSITGTKTVVGLSSRHDDPGSDGKTADLGSVAALDGNAALTRSSDRLLAKAAADLYKQTSAGQQADLTAARNAVRADVNAYRSVPDADDRLAGVIADINRIDAEHRDGDSWSKTLDKYLVQALAPALKAVTGTKGSTSYGKTSAEGITTDPDGTVHLPRGAKAGDVIVFGFDVANNGSTTLTGITATDRLEGVGAIAWSGPASASSGSHADDGSAGGTSAVPPSLAPGQEASGTASYTLTDGDIAKGELTNTVHYAADGASADASVTVKIAAPGIATGVLMGIRQASPWQVALAVLVIIAASAGMALLLRRRRAARTEGQAAL